MEIAQTALYVLLAIACIIVSFVAHSVYRETLQEYSHTSLIPGLQNGPTWFIELMKLISWFSDDGIFIFMLGFYSFFNRAASMYIFVVSGLIGASLEYVKMLHIDGRPFYLVKDDSIQALNCEDKDFGRPSGHLFASGSIFILFWLFYFDQ